MTDGAMWGEQSRRQSPESELEDRGRHAEVEEAPLPPLPRPSGPSPLTQDDELCVGLVVPLEVLGRNHRAVIYTTVPPSRLVKGQVSICTRRRV